MERTCTALFKVAKTGSQSQSLSPIKAITEQVKKKCDYTSLVAQMVKNLPTVRETQVQSLGQEDPLREGNSNPLQYSCLENSMDRGAWQATVHGVARVGHDLVITPPPL